jgi:hypothetical protein
MVPVAPGSLVGSGRWTFEVRSSMFDVRCSAFGSRTLPALKGLVLRRRCHTAVGGQVAQEQLHLGLGGLEVFPRAHLVELDVAPDPVAIGPLGADGVVLEPHDFPNLVEQLEFGIGRDQILPPNHRRGKSRTWGLTLALGLHRLGQMLMDPHPKSIQCFGLNMQ